MKIALPYDQMIIFQHFGQTKQFKVYTIEAEQIIASTLLTTQETGHSALVALLYQQQIDILICGGIGECAKQALDQAKIKLICGASGNADDQVADFLAGRLQLNPVTVCGQHEGQAKHNHHHHCHNH